MKENALAASSPNGGLRLVAEHVAALARQGVEIHVLAHSAGSILLGPLVRLLTATGPIGEEPLADTSGHGVAMRSCTMWAPACTIDFFRRFYLLAVDDRKLDQITLFTLTDKAEQDDHCAHIYNKSLLYLVSRAFGKRLRNPLWPADRNPGAAGEPLLGMEWWLSRDRELAARFRVPVAGKADPAREGPLMWIKSPNTFAAGSRWASASRGHGAFDDDVATVQATLARILGRETLPAGIRMEFEHSDSYNRDRREAIMRGTERR
jgi:hypothetical protein